MSRWLWTFTSHHEKGVQLPDSSLTLTDSRRMHCYYRKVLRCFSEDSDAAALFD